MSPTLQGPGLERSRVEDRIRLAHQLQDGAAQAFLPRAIRPSGKAELDKLIF